MMLSGATIVILSMLTVDSRFILVDLKGNKGPNKDEVDTRRIKTVGNDFPGIYIFL